jgi:hypothetical protein
MLPKAHASGRLTARIFCVVPALVRLTPPIVYNVYHEEGTRAGKNVVNYVRLLVP